MRPDAVERGIARLGEESIADLVHGGKDAGELLGRMAYFGGIEAHAFDPVEPRLGGLQRREGRILVEVAQEAEDQLRAQAMPSLRIAHRGEQPGRQPHGTITRSAPASTRTVAGRSAIGSPSAITVAAADIRPAPSTSRSHQW